MKIAVIGSGVMGSGIAQVLASQYKVVVRDIQSEALAKAKKSIEKNLGRSVEKAKLTQEGMDAIMANLTFSSELSDIADSDLVIEAATENANIKKAIFKELDQVVKAEAILATNTSSLSITEVAMATQRPTQVIGLHFFNPVPMMALVEIISGQVTDVNVVEKVREVVLAINKTPVIVNEAPGFVVNRILIPMINEAIACLHEGVASAEDIDTAMKLGANHPLGPLALGDLIGLDVCLAIMETLFEELGDKYKPHQLLKKKVRANQLGRKTGQGFFTY
ncbi:MAG: 3-hydroxyacyl-CoA dehydrogenase NAD-binding domain-containing protein [Erysipelotrichaceae bacterium]|nr:3-hydroxyacyl-CoA dehydrogenase NAD-binding domain-containing protein [Erysipelotrichaceae bacterium]